MPTQLLNSNEILTETELDVLRLICSPTVANAVEVLTGRPRHEGYTHGEVRCLFPQMGPMVGYASTATILSGQPAAPKRLVDRREYWESLLASPGPRVAVLQDLSETPVGAYWGEVNSNIHKRLGCLGVLTNGAVRDLDEVERLQFHFFARAVNVSHGWAHLEDFNRPVKVFGLTVHPGDLVHADKHGAVVIPPEVARHVAAKAAEIDREERRMIDLCQGLNFSIAELDTLISKDY